MSHLGEKKPSIQDIIVVEGFHDRQAVERAVDADIWVIGGDRIAHRFLEELKRASQHRGILVLTDPDGPGERIRKRIAAAIPTATHAFIDRKKAQAKHGVGVEHASAESILEALQKARAVTESRQRRTEFSLHDLVEAGMVGTEEAARLRTEVGRILNIGYANAKAFVNKLNVLGVTRAEWEAAICKLKGQDVHE